jgi:hypothetical protein
MTPKKMLATIDEYNSLIGLGVLQFKVAVLIFVRWV